MDNGDSRPNRYIYITVPVLLAQGTSGKRAKKNCKIKVSRKSVPKTVSPRNECINKTGTMTINAHINMDRRNFAGFHPYIKRCGQLMTGRRWVPLLGFIFWVLRLEAICTQITKTDLGCNLFTPTNTHPCHSFGCTLTLGCVCITTITKEKKEINFRARVGPRCC